MDAGTRLGAYEIVSPLGAGGMGEVYRARDTRLGREVALKILPAGFSRDPERIGRFQREAQLLAALNHPHIGAIYGLEGADSTQFLVLELVEGETLASRLSRGRLPVADALAIAREIIDALEAAHDKGIIHRDLKPSNIALTSDGHVKVLDFGLAKATDPNGSDIAGGGLTQSPTFTLAATQAGVILGTAAYMSPEQAKGRAADKRSDVWAFGCVLFEMLAGTRAFEGEDVSDTMAAVLRGEPAWDSLPDEVPAALRTILRRCLEKDRRARIPDVSVIRYMLDEADSAQAGAAPAPPPASARSVRRWVPWAVAGGLLLAAAAGVLLWQPWRSASDLPAVRLRADLGVDASLITLTDAAIALSPDGRVAAFVAAERDAARSQLFVRRLDQLQATPIAGSDGAVGPFFSPDGQWIAFFSGGKLRKVASAGGASVALADAPTPRGGVWMQEDTIVFAPDPAGALLRVSSAGGPTEEFTTLADGHSLHRWPTEVPNGRIVFTVGTGGGFSTEGVWLAVRDPDGTIRELVRGGYFPRYAASGHLLYMANGTLFAARFDAERGELASAGVPVLEAIANNSSNGSTQVALSVNGTAAYLPGETLDNDAAVNWLDASGKPQPLRAMPANWSNPEFAPDGTRLAMDIWDGSQADVWIYEWSRDTLSRLTFDAADDQRPVWTPDGRRIAFISRRDTKSAFNLYWQRSDGTGDVQRLTESANSDHVVSSFHPSGQFLAYDELNVKTGRDLMILPLEGDEAAGWKPGKPQVFLQTPQNEGSAMFSPDGRWIAYISNETGRNEIYVRPFPGPGGKWQVSNGPADDPTWSPQGGSLFFASTNDLRIMTAPYTVQGDSFRVEKPRSWSEGRFVGRPRPPSRDFAIHPDGRRFAVASPDETPSAGPQNQIVFVFNFFDELRRVVK